MDLFVVRHAKTIWNEENRYQGHSDTELSPRGIIEAKSWDLQGIHPDIIFSSPLKRAFDTAKIIFPNKEILVDARLKEMSLGNWEGKTRQEVREEFGELPNGGWYGLDFRGHGGETMNEVIERLRAWLNDVSRLNAQSIFVVSHKATLTSLFALATGWDNLSKPKPRIRFPGLHKFSLDQKGKVTCIELNLPLSKKDFKK